ncbi:P-loop NTPase family protein [Furfurilactobacillus cerevisiae]|uniref:hypothetical protein n=1 Tax=Furfurilactobacillus rossiae TaxID=231049 RepID=UPI003B984206
MKIYLCGSVGSGKSTIARKLASQTGWPAWSLDDITWVRGPVAQKRPEKDRIARVNEICQRQNFIVEGAQLGWIGKTTIFERADLCILLEPSIKKVRWQIDSRFVKQLLHLEHADYQPTWQGLKDMHRWQHQYNQNDRQKVRLLIAQAAKTPTICANFAEVQQAVLRFSEKGGQEHDDKRI